MKGEHTGAKVQGNLEKAGGAKEGNDQLKRALKTISDVHNSLQEAIKSFEDLDTVREGVFIVLKAHNSALKKTVLGITLSQGKSPFTAEKYTEINQNIDRWYRKGDRNPYNIYRKLCDYYDVEQLPKETLDRNIEKMR